MGLVEIGPEALAVSLGSADTHSGQHEHQDISGGPPWLILRYTTLMIIVLLNYELQSYIHNL